MSKKRFNITAIIYDKRGNVLSVGKNSYVKTHPLQARHAKSVGEPEKIFLHAEIHAITKCLDLSKAFSILVTRFDESGKPVTAKPCRICARALRLAGIKEVKHT